MAEDFMDWAARVATPQQAEPTQGGVLESQMLRGAYTPSEWTDSAIPLEDRARHLMRSYARAGRPAQEVLSRAQEVMPEANPRVLGQLYQQHAQLAQSEQRFQDWEESPIRFLNRRVFPFVSSIGRTAETTEYTHARRRFDEGAPEPGDYDVIARYERQTQAEGQRGLGGQILSGLAHVPAIAGEAAVGGAALRGVGIIGEGAAAGAAHFLGRAAAQTAVMPSMWLPGTAERAQENGGEWYDPRNLAPAFALGTMQTAVFGSLGAIGNNITGRAIGDVLRRNAVRVGTGMLEQQAVDVLAGATGLQTGYGLLGDILSGRGDAALAHGVVQAVTFAAFAGLHEAQQPRPNLPRLVDRMVEKLQTRLNEAARQGEPAGRAGESLAGLFHEAQEALRADPTLSPRDALSRAAESVREGPIRDLAQEMAEAFPMRRAAREPWAPEAPETRPAPEEVNRPHAIEEGPEGHPGWTSYPSPEGRPPEAPPAAPEPSRAPEAAPTPAPRPENAWNHTGTEFRDHPQGGQEFTGQNGQQYRIANDPPSFSGVTRVHVHDGTGAEIAHVGFTPNEQGHLEGHGLWVDPAHRNSRTQRTGVAEAMYDYPTSAGEHIVPVGTSGATIEGQTPEGARFWQRNRERAAPAPPAPPAMSAAERLKENMRRRSQGLAPLPTPEQPRQRVKETPEAVMRRERAVIQEALAETPPGAQPPPAPGEPVETWQQRALQNRVDQFRDRFTFHMENPSLEGVQDIAQMVDRLRRMAEGRGLDPHDLITHQMPELAEMLGPNLRELLDLSKESADATRTATREAQRLALSETSVRRGIAERLQVALEAAQVHPAGEGESELQGPRPPERPAEAAGEPQAGGEPPAPAPTERGAAGGDVLTPADRMARGQSARKAYAEQAQAEGFQADDLHALAKDMTGVDKEGAAQHNEMLQAARRALREFGGYVDLIHLEKYEDSTSIPHLDEVAHDLMQRYPNFVEPWENPADALFRLLKEGNRQPRTQAQTYEEALSHLRQLRDEARPTEEDIADVNRQLGEVGEEPATPRDLGEAQNEALQASIDAESKDFLQPEAPTGTRQRTLYEPDIVKPGWINETVVPSEPLYRPNEPGATGERPSPGRGSRLGGEPPGAVALREPGLAGSIARFIAGDEGTVWVPDLSTIKDWISHAKDSFRIMLAPASRGPEAQRAAGILRQDFAVLAKQRRTAERVLHGTDMHFEDHVVNAPTDAERTDRFLSFMDPLQGVVGAAYATPEEQHVADAMRTAIDERAQGAYSRGMIQQMIKNYVGQLWKDPAGGRLGFTHERVHQSYREGIAAGLEPVDWNPVRLVLKTLEHVDKTIMGHDATAELRANSLLEAVQPGYAPLPGWVKVPDDVTALFHERGGPKGETYAPEPVARLLTNYARPGLQGNAAYDVVRGFGNLQNMFQLGFSAFHAGFVFLDTQVSAAALGLQMISRGQFAEGLKRVATSPAAPFQMWGLGSKMLREYFGPGSQGADIAALVKAHEEAGGRALMDRFYESDHVMNFRRALSAARAGKGFIGTPLAHALPALTELLSRPTMEMLVPRMKMGVFGEMARHELARLGNAPDHVRKAALGRILDSVDNRLGQMTYDNVFWNKTFKDVMMAGVRSVGWNVGTWRELVGGLKDVLGSIGAIRRGEGISPRAAYVVALPMVTALYGAMYQYLATGQGPQEDRDLFFPRTGATRRDGSPERMSLPSYMRDVYHMTNRAGEGPVRWLGNIGDTARGKINPGLSTAWEMMSNRDWQGAAISNPNDPWTRQAMDQAQHLIGGFQPFAYRTVQGEPGRAAQGFVGLTPAPGYITRTAEQQRAMESGRRMEPTPLERRRRNLYQQLRR